MKRDGNERGERADKGKGERELARAAEMLAIAEEEEKNSGPQTAIFTAACRLNCSHLSETLSHFLSLDFRFPLGQAPP